LNKYILEGQLEYDSKLGYNSEQIFPQSFSEEQISIKVSYPSKAFGEDNNEFSKRHEAM